MSTPNNTAIRTALWRALHLQVDPLPHIIEDEEGLRLAAPELNWQQRPDMHPEFTKQARASIVARARFVEDLVSSAIPMGIHQYVILGAGLDTFALRHRDLSPKVTIYEIDEPQTQDWKKERLCALGMDIPANLKFVPIDFEKTSDWLSPLAKAGFDARSPAIIASTGVSMYLTREAIWQTFREVAMLAPGTILAMSFLIPLQELKPEDRPLLELAIKGAAAAGTPFLSFFTPEKMLELSAEGGLPDARIVSGEDLNAKYFSGRDDGFSTSNGEQLLMAKV